MINAGTLVSFPMKLDLTAIETCTEAEYKERMKPITDAFPISDYSANYELQAIPYHHGEIVYQSHFNCVTRSLTRSKWIEFNDSQSQTLTNKQIPEKNAYLLVYIRNGFRYSSTNDIHSHLPVSLQRKRIHETVALGTPDHRCYSNSLIQILSHVPLFSLFFLKEKPPTSASINVSEDIVSSSPVSLDDEHTETDREEENNEGRTEDLEADRDDGCSGLMDIMRGPIQSFLYDQKDETANVSGQKYRLAEINSIFLDSNNEDLIECYDTLLSAIV